jgi:hypothetical protein
LLAALIADIPHFKTSRVPSLRNFSTRSGWGGIAYADPAKAHAAVRASIAFLHIILAGIPCYDGLCGPILLRYLKQRKKFQFIGGVAGNFFKRTGQGRDDCTPRFFHTNAD